MHLLGSPFAVMKRKDMVVDHVDVFLVICFKVLLAAGFLAPSAFAYRAGGWRALVGLWACLEGLHVYFNRRRMRRLATQKQEPLDWAVARQEGTEAIEQLLKLGPDVDPQAFISGWFLPNEGSKAAGANAPVQFEDVRRGNLIELIAYGFFYRSVDELRQEDPAAIAHVDAMVTRLLDTWSISCPAGHNPKIRVKAHLWEPVRQMHLPLALYLFSELLGHWTKLALPLYGYRQTALGYYVLPARPAQDGARQRGWLAWARAQVAACAAAATRVAARPVVRRLLALELERGGLGASERSSRGHSRTSSWGWAAAGSDTASDTTEDAVAEASLSNVTRRSGKAPHGGSLRSRHASQNAFLGRDVPRSREGHGAGVAIVVLHGLGVGLMPYTMLMRRLSRRFPECPIVAKELTHAALRFPSLSESLHAGHVPTPDEVADEVHEQLQALGYERALLVGHSYGTFVAARFCRMYPEMTHGICLLDPVSLMCCAPDLLSRFVYETVRPVRDVSSLMMDVTKVACAQDPVVAHAMSRRFLWHRVCFWSPSDMPAGSVIFVGKRDSLVPYRYVQHRFAMDERLHVITKDCVHGECLTNPVYTGEIIDALVPLLRPSEGARGGQRGADAAQTLRVEA
ncbi:unnamed protein product [Pedinophyceae sp. YPF-701]|nr:unnamed protein product [Pedinophyceae sp. YPF-701]